MELECNNFCSGKWGNLYLGIICVAFPYVRLRDAWFARFDLSPAQDTAREQAAAADKLRSSLRVGERRSKEVKAARLPVGVVIDPPSRCCRTVIFRVAVYRRTTMRTTTVVITYDKHKNLDITLFLRTMLGSVYYVPR